MNVNNMWVADFETITAETNYFKKHNRTGIVYGYVENMGNENINKEFITIGDFLEYFKSRRCNQTVFFHNLSFDGVFILDWLGKNGYTLTEEMEDEGHFSVFRTTGSKIYKIQLLYKPRGCKKCRTLTFQCSKLILSSSVKALGNTVNLSKFNAGEEEDENFYNREPEQSLHDFYYKNKAYCEYCKRDVKIVIKSLKDFYQAIYDFLVLYELEHNMNKVFGCITISAVSFLLQKLMIGLNGMMEEEIQLHKIIDRVTMDKFTNGGLTINNYEYIDNDLKDVDGYIIDLKSAYPAVMSGDLPYGDMLLSKPQGKYCTFQEIYYERIWADNHKVPLLKNWTRKINDPNYFLECENYTTYLLKEEVEVLEKLYKFKGKKVIREYYFQIKPYLTEFIEKMFHYKEYYKKIGELGKSHTFKILLNSGYGIHAKRMDFKIVVPFCAEDTIIKKDVTYEICDNIDLNQVHRHSHIPNNHLDAYAPNLDTATFMDMSHKAIANYITAKTRIKIMEGILHFGPNNFVYCDTDSLFLINLSKEHIKKYCGDKLGDWEIEDKQFDEALFLRAKLYQVKKNGKIIKSGAAGFDSKQIDYTKAHLNKFLEIKDATLIPLRVDGGLVLIHMDKFIKLSDKSPLLKKVKLPQEFDEVIKKNMVIWDGKKKI